MKIYIPAKTNRAFSGGQTFVRNLIKALPEIEFIFEPKDDFDLLFVANPMQASREDFLLAKNNKKRIVLRLDNIPEDKNNRGTAISRLLEFIPQADFVVFQSQWAKEKYIEFCECNNLRLPENTIIYNAVDEKIFKPDGDYINFLEKPIYIYVHTKGDNKRWPEAREIYRRHWAKNKQIRLIIVGPLPEEERQYNFGFYNKECFIYMGVPQTEEQMAKILRSGNILIYPSYAECCPNTVIEARMCGLKIENVNPYGGTIELLDKPLEFFKLKRLAEEYKNVFLS